ncbi:MAG: toxin VasX [Dysgonomonas sp.]|nr:toxin VasX [Dysgonomonas sp.]
MTNRNNDLNTIGTYNVKISSKAPTVTSDTLPIYQGIKIYPLRFGIHQRKSSSEELLHIKIVQLNGEEYSLSNRNNPEPLQGTTNTRYPKLDNDNLYDYFPMPLRDGWVYVVSKYAKGVYEYQHLNYKFKLHTLHKSKKSDKYPTNTLWQYFIQCADVDEVYLFYSEVRLEENFLRSRFFKDSQIPHLSAGFSVRKWQNKKETNYKSNIYKSRVAPVDLRVSVANDNIGKAYEDVIDKVCNELNVNKQKNKERLDAFLIIDDIIGIGKELIANIEYKHVELQGLVKSLQTGVALDDILESFTHLNEENINNPEAFSNQESSSREAGHMHTMALLLKNFFFEMKVPDKEKDLKKYIDKGRNKINENTLNAILGIDIRKEMCEHIDKYREVMYVFLGSKLFRNYCRFFLDKDEYAEVEDEGNLPFLVPQKFIYDFLKEGAIYNAMAAQVKSLVEEHYKTLSLSPYKTDMYLAGEDPYQDFIRQIETLSGTKLEGHMLLNKEVIGYEYFLFIKGNPIQNVNSFFQREDFPVWETMYPLVSAISSSAEVFTKEVLERKVSATIEWNLQKGTKGDYTLADRGSVKKGIRYSVVIENDNSLLIRVKDAKGNIEKQLLKFPESPDLQVTKTQKGANIQVKNGTYNRQKMNAEGIFTLYIDLYPRANWSAVKNLSQAMEHIKLQSINILNKILANRYFGIAMPMLSFYLISKTLQDPDRAALRKTNDVTVNLAILGTLAESFLPKAITEGYMKNPLRGVQIRGKSLAARIPRTLLFRSFMVVANVGSGVEGMLQGSELWQNGNTITGLMTGILGFTLIFASFLFVFGPLGWVAYLVITILASIAMLIVSLFIDTDLEVFLEDTVFHLDYRFGYLQKGNLDEKIRAVYKDIFTLSTVKNKAISRKDKRAFMKNFKYQLDELAMIHLYAPSFQQCYFGSTYNMQRYTPESADTMAAYPSDIRISIIGNFSIFTSIFGKVEMGVYMSHESNPEWDDLIPLKNYQGTTEQICINGRINDAFAPRNHWVQDTREDIIHAPGAMQYHLTVMADKQCKIPRELATYPFFYYDRYYIFMYMRFQVKGGDWMPSARTSSNHYLRYRYQLKKIKPLSKYTRYNLGDYDMYADDIAIKPFPTQKLK